MTGQDAANTAKAFHDALPLTGVVLTKTDGDARGGAALSVRYITGQPIKFIGVGEKTDALEPFHPDRLASRILGMGDVLSLVEEVERKVDKDKAAEAGREGHEGQALRPERHGDQLQQMVNMGGMASMIDKLPGMGAMSEHVKAKVNDKRGHPHDRHHQFHDASKERRHPDLLKVRGGPALHAGRASSRPTSTGCSSSTSRWKK